MSIAISDAANQALTQWLDQLMTGDVELHQLPPSVAAFYLAGHAQATQSAQERINDLDHQLNVRYTELYNPKEIASKVISLMETAENREKTIRELDARYAKTTTEPVSQSKETTMTTPTPEVTVYSKPGCVQCNATYTALDKAGIEYNKVDVSKDESALDKIKKMGYMQAPVVVAGNESWSGFRPDKIENLSKEPPPPIHTRDFPISATAALTVTSSSQPSARAAAPALVTENALER